MPLETPSDLELNTIRELIDFTGLCVLEIGTGDGRLAWPFAAEAAAWVALDPEVEDIRLAAKEMRQRGKDRQREVVRLSIGDARQLAFPDSYFDLAFFTWSLC
jgi:ubiquinone/menaquinone biosynthesis C-methylase UbiE